MLQRTLPTGIEILDERLGGGVAAGSIVALTAKPASQVERFLAQLTQPRPTTYLTTQRTREAVETSLRFAGADVENCTVRQVPPDATREDAYEPITSLPESSTLVIDPMSPFEACEKTQFSNFVNHIQERVRATGSLAFLHCLDGERPPEHRDTTEYMADTIFDLETSVYGDTIENRLFVPKARLGQSVSQAIKLDLTSGVTIDTSRDIA